MMWRFFTILVTMVGLTSTLNGCDDADVSGMERRVFTNAANLAKLPDARGLSVEIHGAPWPGATPDQIAIALRMPKGVAKALRFRAVAPNQWIIGNGERLVLHFNPINAPNHIADCGAKEEFQTMPPPKTGFIVNATYCKKEEWQIHANLTSKLVKQDDWFSYTIVMERLLGVLFPEN